MKIENVVSDLLEIGDPMIEDFTALFNFVEKWGKRILTRMRKDLCSLA